ncbi:MAG: TIGR02594 family protein [Xanthobacteraceae bacterium]
MARLLIQPSSLEPVRVHWAIPAISFLWLLLFGTVIVAMVYGYVTQRISPEGVGVLNVVLGLQSAGAVVILCYWFSSTIASYSKSAWAFQGGYGGQGATETAGSSPDGGQPPPSSFPAGGGGKASIAGKLVRPAQAWLPASQEGETAATITLRGKVSHFGGPNDRGVKPDEGLALIEPDRVDRYPQIKALFLAEQPASTTGLARRLDPAQHYIACRWDYSRTPKPWLRAHQVIVRANGKSVKAQPIDWGPAATTGRVADLSPGLMAALGIVTDDVCEVIIPLPEAPADDKSDMPGGPPWLARAIALRGLYERSGSADNPEILEMARICGGQIAATYKHDEIPWCALFVNYCLVASGRPGNDSLWALDFANYGRRLPGPAVGAIASKKRSGGGHVFLVIGRDSAGRLVGIGGNQSDMVCDDAFDPEAIVAYTWPEDFPLPAKGGASKTDVSMLPVVMPSPRSKRPDVALLPA